MLTRGVKLCITMQLPTLLENKTWKHWEVVLGNSRTPPSQPWPRTLWLSPFWKVERKPAKENFRLWSRSGKWNKKLAYQLGRKFLCTRYFEIGDYVEK
jgi:hypothetical protein